MHDGVDVVLAEYLLQQRGVARVAEDKVAGGDRSLEAGGQIIERQDVFASQSQLSDNMAADISGAASDQYLIVFTQFSNLPCIYPKEL